MFKKPSKSKPSQNSNKSLSQFGLFDLPDNFDDTSDLSGDDEDLEAELAAISGGAKPKPKAKPKPALLPPDQLSAMIANSLRDIPSDEELSGGDDDPDILEELNDLTLEEEASAPSPPPRVTSRSAPPPPLSSGNKTIELIQERISNYTLAQSNAKAGGESSRARRFERGLKTLQDLLKQAKAGKTISEEDIPPQVSTTVKQTPAPSSTTVETPDVPSGPLNLETPVATLVPDLPSPSSPAEPSSPTVSSTSTTRNDAASSVNPQLKIILEKRNECKEVALKAKQDNDKETALANLKMVKQFDQVITMIKSGQEVDLSKIIPNHIVRQISTPAQDTKENSEVQNAADIPPKMPDNVDPETGLVAAKTIKEALEQHLAVYKEQELKAKEQNNSSKARRMGRIIKQYETAIKQHSAGRPVAFEELPTPPGYAPPPGTVPVAAPELPTPAPAVKPEAPSPSVATKPTPTPQAMVSTRADKQLAFLLKRQKEFKEAALEAKNRGEIEQAKDYLRKMKGFDSVIEAARGGLAVDLESLPLPPQAKQQLENTFDMISETDCLGESDDIIGRLEEQLSTQLKLCLATRDHNRAMANVAETNRFERLAMSVKQDLDVVKLAKRLGQPPPKFHFEMKQFSIVQCNTDLNDNDLELTIVRGVNYNVNNPKEIDTYVKFEFPHPQEAPVTNKTSTVYNTNNPEYNSVFPLSIQRTSRACQRVFKRHAIKIQVYSKGGIFSRDQVIGTTAIKLQPLENTVTIHEAFPLMDGRKATGGSLEVKLRVRDPILTKQIVSKTQKWLVIDHEKS